MTSRQHQQRFEALLHEHRRIVFKVAGLYSRSVADRDDLVQEISTQSWRSFARYDDRQAKFSTWLYRIALNVAISQARRWPDLDRCEPLDARHLETIGGESTAEPDERLMALHSFIGQLDPFNRALEIVAWIFFVVWAASFWVAHRHVPHLLVMGLLLHVYGIGAIWSCATQLFLLARIYLFDAPVLLLQRWLAQLRRFRVYSTLALGLPWWCLWLLVTLVAIADLTGVDLYAAGATWVWANMAVGLAGIGFSVWLARHLAGRSIRSRFLQRIVDDMSGRNLLSASRQLDEIARFERA